MNTQHLPFARCFPNFGFSGFKPLIRRGSLSWRILTIMCCFAGLASAAQFGDFTYTDNGTTITITGYPAAAVGAVVIPDTIVGKPVTGIGTGAFQYCTSVTSVSIPSGVTGIANNTFFNCISLASVTIPGTVSTIGVYAFYNCISLTSMPLPSGVASIGTNAFYLCKGLTTVTIPSTVTSLGAGAFYGCSSLASVAIPSSVNMIPGGFFYSCSGLTSVTIPSTVTSIGPDAFRYCSGLTSVTLPGGLLTIGNRAFANCRGLTSMQIPASVTTIGTTVFDSCSALPSIGVDAANAYFSSVNGVLANKAGTQLIACPAGVTGGYSIPSGVTSIAVAAFANCAKITAVTFPASVTGIGSQAFSNCKLLTQANFNGDAPTIASNAFELTATNFTIFFSNTSNGFTTPTWLDYPAYSMGEGGNPVAFWLLSKGLPANADLKSDSNGDGVSLLMAYALNLDPNQNLSGGVPQPGFAADQMSLSFYSGAPGVTYVVEASPDLVNWSAEGVALSLPDANQFRTATVNLAGAATFMRLSVSH